MSGLSETWNVDLVGNVLTLLANWMVELVTDLLLHDQLFCVLLSCM